MQRVAGWERRLIDLIGRRTSAPFAWGQLDCVIFAADVVEALIGIDPIADVRGAYGEPRQAVAMVSGGGGLDAMLASRLAPLGARQVRGSCAQRGDIVLMSQAGIAGRLAVAYPPSAIGPGEGGLGRQEIPRGAVAWHFD